MDRIGVGWITGGVAVGRQRMALSTRGENRVALLDPFAWRVVGVRIVAIESVGIAE